jgi:hypothetical protein
MNLDNVKKIRIGTTICREKHYTDKDFEELINACKQSVIRRIESELITAINKVDPMAAENFILYKNEERNIYNYSKMIKTCSLKREDPDGSLLYFLVDETPLLKVEPFMFEPEVMDNGTTKLRITRVVHLLYKYLDLNNPDVIE